MTHRHTKISIGKKEREILRYLLNHQDERFNARQYSKLNSVNRTTVIDNLNRLIRKDLVEKPYAGNYKITKKGTDFLAMSESVRNVRSPCRAEKLSVHFFKYAAFIGEEITKEKFLFLNPIKTETHPLPNFTEHHLYFDDATITLKKKQIIIHIKDIVGHSVDDSHDIAFHKCMAYISSIKLKGIKVEGLRVFSKPHYARVGSYLAKKLSKIDKKYHLNFADGSKFFIDYSDEVEDETTDAEYRKRIDEIFLDAKESKSVFSDVDRHDIDLDKLKEITLNQAKTVSGLIDLHIQDEMPKKKEQLKMPDSGIVNYFG